MTDFYIIDATTGRNRGSVVIDNYDAPNEPRELLIRALDQLYLLGYDSGFTNPAIEQLVTDIKFYLNGGKVQ